MNLTTRFSIKYFKLKYSLCGEIGAEFNNVTAILAIDKNDKWISIYGIESKYPNKKNAQSFIKELKRTIPKDFTLYSSVPLNDTWKHICDKYEIKYKE